MPILLQHMDEWKSPDCGLVVYPCSECGVIGYPGYLYDNPKVSVPLLVPYPNFFITFHIPCIIYTMALPQLWLDRNYKNVRTNYYCWFVVRSDPLVISVKICLVLFLAIYSSAAFFYLIWIFPTSIMDHFNSGVLINLLWQQQFDIYYHCFG